MVDAELCKNQGNGNYVLLSGLKSHKRYSSSLADNLRQVGYRLGEKGQRQAKDVEREDACMGPGRGMRNSRMKVLEA